MRYEQNQTHDEMSDFSRFLRERNAIEEKKKINEGVPFLLGKNAGKFEQPSQGTE